MTRFSFDEVLVATLQLDPAKVVRPEIAGLEHRSHGAVEHEDPLAHEREQFVGAVETGVTGCHLSISVIFVRNRDEDCKPEGVNEDVDRPAFCGVKWCRES